MESGWISNNGLPPSVPSAFSNLNPYAHVFVPRPRSSENDGSFSAATSQPPAPFQQPMPSSLERATVTPPSIYPGPIVHANTQYVPLIYGPPLGPPLIQNYLIASLSPNSNVQLPQNQFIQNEQLELPEIQDMSLENEDPLLSEGSLNEEFSVGDIHESCQNYEPSDCKTGTVEEPSRGTERLQSSRDINSEESDKEKSVGASNQESDKNITQHHHVNIRARGIRESFGDNDRYSWNEECIDNRSERSVEQRQHYHDTNKGYHLRGKGTRSFRGHESYSHRDRKQDPEESVEEGVERRSDRSAEKGQYHQTYKGHYEDSSRRGRGSQSFTGSNNTYGGRRNWEDHRKTDGPTNKEYFEKGYDRNERGFRRGRGSGGPFRGNDRAYDRESKVSEASNFTQEQSVRSLNEEPLGQGHYRNYHRQPNEYDHKQGRGRGNYRNRGNWNNYSEKRDFSHHEPSAINPEHGVPPRRYESNNDSYEKEKYEKVSERSEPKPETYDNNRRKSLHETDTSMDNKPEPKIENTEHPYKRETKIQQVTYSEKTQKQFVKKSYGNPKENDWRSGKNRNRESNFDMGTSYRDNQRYGSNFSKDPNETIYDKRKRNSNLDSPENQFQRNNQPKKFDSGRENKHSNTRNRGDFDGNNLQNDNKKYNEDTKSLPSAHEHAVDKSAQNQTKTDKPASLVGLDSEDIQESKAHSKEKNSRNEKAKIKTHKSVSKSHQEYSDTSCGDKADNNSDSDDNLSLVDRIKAEETKRRLHYRVDRENFPTSPDNDKTSKKNTKKNDIESPKLLDPRMERKKEKAVDGSKGMRVSRESSAPVVNAYLDDSLEKEKRDKEFDFWDNHWEEIDEFKNVCEIQGDLFEQPKDFSMAHCVAEDLRMGSGIAVSFKREFKNLPNLLDQRAKQGGLATILDQENGRFIYYLVTKKESTGKPTYYTMWKSLCKMRDHIKEKEVKKLAVPRVGCGLDRLEWEKVKTMLEYLFREMEIEIRVCNFQQPEQVDYKSKCKLVMENMPVTKIDPGTLILYLATVKGEEDDVIKNMSNKFHFWPSFKKQEKTLGDIVYFDDKVQNYGICACIVRENQQEPISFLKLHSCLQKINKKNKEFGSDCFEYVAFQWVNPNNYSDDLINQKFITMLINYLRNVNVHVCSGDFEEQKT